MKTKNSFSYLRRRHYLSKVLSMWGALFTTRFTSPYFVSPQCTPRSPLRSDSRGRILKG